MRAGELDRRITIERPTFVDGEYGEQPGPWEVVAARVPAQKYDTLPSKSETVTDGLKQAVRPARLRIRYMRGLSSDMRVIVHDETDALYQISGGPAEIGRREWTEMTITAYSTQGA